MSSGKVLVVEVKTLLPIISSLRIKFIAESAFILPLVFNKIVDKIKTSYLIGLYTYLYNISFYYNYSTW